MPVICTRCRGKGRIDYTTPGKRPITRACTVCHGRGVVPPEWLEAE